NCDCVLDFAQVKADVNAGDLRHIKLDFRTGDGLEAGLLNRQLVSARVQQGDRVIALCVGAGGAPDAGLAVRNRDLCIRHGCSRRVGHQAGDLRRLTKGGARESNEQAETGFHETSSSTPLRLAMFLAPRTQSAPPSAASSKGAGRSEWRRVIPARSICYIC